MESKCRILELGDSNDGKELNVILSGGLPNRFVILIHVQVQEIEMIGTHFMCIISNIKTFELEF